MSCTQETSYPYNYASSSGSSSPTELHYPSLPTYLTTSYSTESPPNYSNTPDNITQYPPTALHAVTFEPTMPGSSQYQTLTQNTIPAQYPESAQLEYPAPEQHPNAQFGSHQAVATHQHQLQGHHPHPQPRSRSRESAPRVDIAHPYARLYAKKEEKRRKIWNHALEKSLFSPYELSTIGAPQRRTIYISSLEAHIDQLHAQLLGIGFWPVAFEKLDPFRGLNSKTAKSMVAGLQHDASVAKIKLLELERSNEGLKNALKGQPGYGPVMADNYGTYP